METLSSILCNAKIEVDAEERDEEDVYIILKYGCAQADEANSMGFDTPWEYSHQSSQVMMALSFSTL